MTKVLKLALLGQAQLTDENEAQIDLVSAKARALLYFLAVDGRIHTRHALANLLWGDLPEADARRNLRGVLLKLRQVVEEHLVINTHDVAFNFAAPHQLDVVQFRQLLNGAPAPSQLQQAIALYRGDFLDEFYIRQAPEFEDWMAQQRTQYQQMVVDALLALADHAQQQGRYEAGIQNARQALALEPVREDAHRLLMRQLALHGQRGLALAQFDVCREIMQAELGVEPAAETAVTLRSHPHRHSGSPPGCQQQHPCPPGSIPRLHRRPAHYPSRSFLWPPARTAPPLQPAQPPPSAKCGHHRPAAQRQNLLPPLPAHHHQHPRRPAPPRPAPGLAA